MLEEASGIAPAIIRERGYHSIYGAESYAQLRQLGFANVQCRLAPGLLVPILRRTGAPVHYQFHPDTPRPSGRTGKTIKYETLARRPIRLDFGVGQADLVANPAVPLVITEGVKKGDCLRTHGYCVIVLAGVWTTISSRMVPAPLRNSLRRPGRGLRWPACRPHDISKRKTA
jgi:hypothetical protein